VSYTISDFFIQSAVEQPVEGMVLKYKYLHDRWKSGTGTREGFGWQRREKRDCSRDTGLFSSCTRLMECLEGVLTAFGLGFPPHVQRKACTDLHLRAHAIDVALPRAIAPIAAFHRMGRGGQQRSIEKRQGCCHRGGTELLQRVPEGWEPLDAPPQRGQCGEGALGPTAPIEPRVPLCHDRT